jgi:hypothetical protein
VGRFNRRRKGAGLVWFRLVGERGGFPAAHQLTPACPVTVGILRLRCPGLPSLKVALDEGGVVPVLVAVV